MSDTKIKVKDLVEISNVSLITGEIEDIQKLGCTLLGVTLKGQTPVICREKDIKVIKCHQGDE